MASALLAACAISGPAPSPTAATGPSTGEATLGRTRTPAATGTPRPTPAPTATPAPTSSETPGPSPTASPPSAASVVSEKRISPGDAGLAFPFDQQRDPTVAIDPGDPDTMVVAYVALRADVFDSCGPNGVAIRLRRSVDGGLTWRDTATPFWRSRGLRTSFHPSLAWGPGPHPGRSRLYFVDTGGPCKILCVLISYSDDAGDTWSAPHLERPTSLLRGSVPDVAADLDPASPNYGAVHVVYNWQPRSGARLWAARGGLAHHGLRPLASRDFGRTWTSVEIDAAPSAAPGRADYLIAPGARVKAGPAGEVYVSFVQMDISDEFDARWTSPAGSRWVSAVQRLTLGEDGRFAKSPTVRALELATRSVSPGVLPAPGVSQYLDFPNGLDVGRATGTVYLALADYDRSAVEGAARGRVRVGRSSDGGKTWAWTALAELPDVDGEKQSSVKATIAVSPRGDRIFVGFHGLTDVASGTSPRRHLVTIGNHLSFSTDGGRTFSEPVAISPSRWNSESVAGVRNGVGLRDRAQFVSDGQVIFVCGDARGAGFAGSPDYGNSDIFGALVRLPPSPSARASRWRPTAYPL